MTNGNEKDGSKDGGAGGTTDEQRRYTASKGWVTRAVKTLTELLGKPESPDIVELHDAVDEFDKRLANFDAAGADVELTFDNEQDIINHIDGVADFRDKSRVCRVKAAKLLNELNKTDVDGVSQPASSTASVDVKLPKLTLPKFGGDVLEWQSFWDQFKATVHDSDLPVISKFSYLLSLLHGEARQAVQGLSMTTDHYNIACQILEDRFGRKERIIFTHVQKLLHVTIPSKCSVSILWKLYDDLLTHTRSLESLGIDGDKYGVILTPLILSRLPQDIRLEWSREGKGKESDLKFLLEFLKGEIQRRERSQMFRETISPVASQTVADEAKRTKMATASALQSTSAPPRSPLLMTSSCGICNKAHTTERCFKLLRATMSERKEKLRVAGLCYRCLKAGHIAKGCSSMCQNCKGRHHVLLCNPTPSSVHASNGNGGNATSGNADKHTMPKSGIEIGDAPVQSNGDNETGRILLNASTSTAANVSYVSCEDVRPRVLLKSVRVKVHGRAGSVEAVVLFDTGADRSYITTDIVRKVSPEWVDTQPHSYAAFGSGKPSVNELRHIFNVVLEGSSGSGHSLHAMEVPVICAPLRRPVVPPELTSCLGDLQFVEDYSTFDDIKVDILIGLDAYWKFVKPNIITVPDSLLAAQSTVFGWMLYGSVPGGQDFSDSVVAHQLLCVDVLDKNIHAFWELESIGIPSSFDEKLRDPVLEKFQENLGMVDDRYEVALPWKPGTQDRLLNNEKLARVRLQQLGKKLNRDPGLKDRYDSAIREMWDNAVIEQVPESEQYISGPVFYMPHRPVVGDTAVTTKVRPVFDASAKSYNGISLNDCMEIGPCLLGNLTEILLRFRRWQFAITADIEKAFLQIGVCKEDRDVHRFLWDADGDIKTMRFRRVPFGNCSSPFLLNATVQSHLASFPVSRVVQELQENMYVDDFLSGADSIDECCSMVQESSDIMSKASMNLVKWGSNSPDVSRMLQRDFRDKFLDAESHKVLGLTWLARDDCFSFHGVSLPEDICVTKRVVLSYFSRLFDPLGFTAPFVLRAKCLFQELWSLGLGWDDEVPPEYQQEFFHWMDGIDVLKRWKIPRRYTSCPWSEIHHQELHGFGDASPKGYGACVYLVAHLGNGSSVSSLVMSKSKVAPLKKVTLPRLELLGSLLCARLIVFVRETLKLPNDVKMTCWTDSMISLSWIRSTPTRWKTFVANRVCEIQSLTCVDQWSHCHGAENPADLVTRGIHAEDLVRSTLWLHGPEFLVDGEGPLGDLDASGDLETQVSQETVDVTLASTSRSCEPVFPVERWSSLTKAIRVVAWVQRFVCNMRKTKEGRVVGDLTYDELQAAKHQLIQCVQEDQYATELAALRHGRSVPKSSSIVKLTPFIAEDGLLRVQGRLQRSPLSWDEKHPIILPKSHLALLLTRFQHVLMKHGGVSAMISALRNTVWIVGVRRIAKRVKKECVSCQKQDTVACGQPMSPLPDVRVNQATPFAVTGLDHAGPVFTCDSPGKKFWILLFTCGVIRAIHLELVPALSTEETLLAIRRFAARRGLPRVLYSDNAKGFVASPSQLQRQFGLFAPEWRFIAPLSPWWGGWWERLVRSMKGALKKTVGANCLSHSELETTIQEIEACVNSRPLTFVSDEVDEKNPLTPAHFLLGHGRGFYSASSQPSPISSGSEMGHKYEIRKAAVDKFWEIWSDEYIRNLPPWRGGEGKCSLREGSLVLVQDVRLPRMRWPLGVVTRLLPGRDGVIRTVEVRTCNGTLVRSVPRLHDLEIMSSGFSDQRDLEPSPQDPDEISEHDNRESYSSVDNVPPVYITRYGRRVKPVKKFDV